MIEAIRVSSWVPTRNHSGCTDRLRSMSLWGSFQDRVRPADSQRTMMAGASESSKGRICMANQGGLACHPTWASAGLGGGACGAGLALLRKADSFGGPRLCGPGGRGSLPRLKRPWSIVRPAIGCDCAPTPDAPRETSPPSRLLCRGGWRLKTEVRSRRRSGRAVTASPTDRVSCLCSAPLALRGSTFATTALHYVVRPQTSLRALLRTNDRSSTPLPVAD